MATRLRKLRPTSGLANFLHVGLILVIPAAVFALVQQNFVQLALLIVVLSKWRIFAVRPRFWPANIRANAVDLIVGFSTVLFINHYTNLYIQIAWAVAYAVWLLFIKPGTSALSVTIQAFLGQLSGLSALYLIWADKPIYILTFLTGLICYFAARHFLDVFEEVYTKMLAYTWGYFAAALSWVLSHWLLFYHGLAQPTLLLSVIGYGMASLYYLDHTGKLTSVIRRQFVFIIVAVVLVVLAFSDWGDKVV